MHTKDLEANGNNALSYIAQVVSGSGATVPVSTPGSALAKYMILAVALSALGSTLTSLVSGVRVTFSMGSDGVLPRQFGITNPRFKTPIPVAAGFLFYIVVRSVEGLGGWSGRDLVSRSAASSSG